MPVDSITISAGDVSVTASPEEMKQALSERQEQDDGFSANFQYQVKVTFERPDTTDVFDTKEQAAEFARQQLKNDAVVKVAIKKVEPKDVEEGETVE